MTLLSALLEREGFNLVVVASAIWNLVTAIAILITVVYSYRLKRIFKGGKIAQAC
jgi:hypothetical protein